jgi:hypothetical protein
VPDKSANRTFDFHMSGNATNQDLAHDLLQIQEVQRKRRRQQTTQVEIIGAGHFFLSPSANQCGRTIASPRPQLSPNQTEEIRK